jgi:hypothetical protein
MGNFRDSTQILLIHVLFGCRIELNSSLKFYADCWTYSNRYYHSSWNIKEVTEHNKKITAKQLLHLYVLYFNRNFKAAFLSNIALTNVKFIYG